MSMVVNAVSVLKNTVRDSVRGVARIPIAGKPMVGAGAGVVGLGLFAGAKSIFTWAKGLLPDVSANAAPFVFTHIGNYFKPFGEFLIDRGLVSGLPLSVVDVGLIGAAGGLLWNVARFFSKFRGTDKAAISAIRKAAERTTASGQVINRLL